MSTAKQTQPAKPAPTAAETAKPTPKADAAAKPADKTANKPAEQGGPAGPEPTRYGDWERNGRCVDF